MFDCSRFLNRMGLVQRDLADMLGCSQSAIAMWSSGRTFPPYSAIVRLIELGATAEEVFGKECSEILDSNRANPEGEIVNIKNFLYAKGWTQIKLAEELGTTSANVNKWVKGTGVPSYEFCKKLIELGMSVEDLFGIGGCEKREEDERSKMEEFMKMFNKAMSIWTIEHVK